MVHARRISAGTRAFLGEPSAAAGDRRTRRGLRHRAAPRAATSWPPPAASCWVLLDRRGSVGTGDLSSDSRLLWLLPHARAIALLLAVWRLGGKAIVSWTARLAGLFGAAAGAAAPLAQRGGPADTRPLNVELAPAAFRTARSRTQLCRIAGRPVVRVHSRTARWSASLAKSCTSTSSHS